MRKNRKTLCAVCLFVLVITLSACSRRDSDISLTQTESKTEIKSSASNEGQPQSTEPSETPLEEDSGQKEENPMQTVLQALAVTAGEDGLHYNSGDPVFIWTALSHAAQMDGLGESVPEETLKNYLSAFFEGVEELPPVDSSVQSPVSYDEAAKSYTFLQPSAPNGTLFLSEPEDLEDGSFKIQGEYMAAEGLKKLSGWYFYVKPSAGVYPYVVQYMENEDYLCSDIYEELQSLTAAETTAAQ